MGNSLKDEVGSGGFCPDVIQRFHRMSVVYLSDSLVIQQIVSALIAEEMALALCHIKVVSWFTWMNPFFRVASEMVYAGMCPHYRQGK